VNSFNISQVEPWIFPNPFQVGTLHAPLHEPRKSPVGHSIIFSFTYQQLAFTQGDRIHLSLEKWNMLLVLFLSL
jgi:hypothetical protein